MSLTNKGVLDCLAHLVSLGKIRALDHQFARFIAQYDESPWVVLASAIISHQSGLGHVCVDLKRLNPLRLFDLSDFEGQQLLQPLALNGLNNWQQELHSALVNSKSQGENAPLKLVNHSLYLQRYWNFEQQIADFLHTRSAQAKPQEIKPLLTGLFSPDYDFIYTQLVALKATHQPLDTFCCDFLNLRGDLSIDYQALGVALSDIDSVERLQQFSAQFSEQQCLDWQKVAVAIASLNRFSVISGGPGTGKTTTVIKLLALLVELDLNSGDQVATPPLNIELVAPTGKAAARLSESISGALDKLAVKQQIKERIPSQASTIHRLLGVIPNRNTFRNNKDNPLHVDVLIVDEASMIDISLMAKLFAAIAPHTKVVLLGDRDQLSSVEAGAVFADICADLAGGARYNQQTADWLGEQTGFEPAVLSLPRQEHRQSSVVTNSLALLHKSYRFNQFSGIGALARAVNQADVAALKAVWQRGYQDIGLHQQGDNAQRQIVQMSINGYRDYLQQAQQISTASDVRQTLALFAKFQLLSPLRAGKSGIDELNQAIEVGLNRYGLIDTSEGSWYIGRPIMIANNDHAQQLYNGDIGILLPDINQPDGPARVYFIMADGQLKSFLPSRLPAQDTVYAMTIHKSQGSEFDHVVISMPTHWSPLLSKELIYTGITRAKLSVDIFSSASVLQKATLTKTHRVSGLSNALAVKV